MPPAPVPRFTTRAWLNAWLRTAIVGTSILVVLFVGYEIVERTILVGRVPLVWLFRLHVLRGITAGVLLGSWAVYSIWRARRAYDAAFAIAYADIERAMEERTAELARAQAFTEQVFESLRDRIQVVDAESRVVKINRVGRELSGLPQPVGAICAMLPHCQRDYCVARRAIEAGAPLLGVERVDPRSGRIYRLDAYPVPNAGGGPPLAIETAHDITEAKQMEAQLRYQEKLAALGVLAAGIAHDIGNPLASMSSELELLEGERDAGRVREAISELRAQVGRIGRTLREMTDFARRRGEEESDVSVEEAVQDALRMVRHDPRARRVRFEVEIAPGLPELRMVEDHLVMVLVNLLINAFDAMPEGGRLLLRASAQDGGVRLCVKDSGVGMTEEVRHRALEPLFTTKQHSRGTGLGLSVSESVMRALGGAIELDSAPGQGTEVRLTFPPAALAAAHRAEAIHG